MSATTDMTSESPKPLVIDDFLHEAGPLAGVAFTIVSYARALDPGADFVRPHVNSDWVLKPENWLAVRLSRGRSGCDPSITITVDLWRENLPSGISLPVLPGRIPCWTKVRVKKPLDVKDALFVLHAACRRVVSET